MPGRGWWPGGGAAGTEPGPAWGDSLEFAGRADFPADPAALLPLERIKPGLVISLGAVDVSTSEPETVARYYWGNEI